MFKNDSQKTLLESNGSIDIEKLWESVLSEVEMSISKANFKTWFKDTFIVKIEEGSVYVGVPNEFVKDWLITKFNKPLLKILRDSIDSIRSIEYVIVKPGEKTNRQKQVIIKAPVQEDIRPVGELPLSDLYINREDNLNPRYTFDSFIVGSFNELAHAASRAIISKLGGLYNPLFIYGNTGLGKTHLIQSVGNEIKKNYPEKRVYYTNSERFAQGLVNALQTNKINAFKEKYRRFDVLIIDDIQFLANKEKSQEELFHLFNALYESNKQIIFSSDQHPNYINGLESRLKSRFGAGMIVDISTPDSESRAAILKTKASQNNIELESEIVDFLASSVDGSIRELEGILNLLVVQTQVKGKPLSLTDIKTMTRNSVKSKRNVSVKAIVKAVSDFYDIDQETIYKKTRKKTIVRPRQVIMYILREDYGIPYPSIGQKLGNRDHTTVIHSYEKIKRELTEDSNLAEEISKIRSML